MQTGARNESLLRPYITCTFEDLSWRRYSQTEDARRFFDFKVFDKDSSFADAATKDRHLSL